MPKKAPGQPASAKGSRATSRVAGPRPPRRIFCDCRRRYRACCSARAAGFPCGVSGQGGKPAPLAAECVSYAWIADALAPGG